MTDVVMPQMGESIVEGTLTKWLKKAGDHVERDEPLFEISTDKVDTEIPSPAAGTLSEVLVEEGKTVGIATVVARIDEGGGAAPAAAQPAAPAEAAAVAPEPKAQPETAPPPPPPVEQAVPPVEPAEPTGPLSPLVRRMAREYSIDLTKVKGTGAGAASGRATARASPAGASRAASALSRTSQDAHRAAEHHAHPHRRAHARQPPYLRARHHHT